MKTIWNTVLRANFRCGRMHRTRAVHQAGAFSAPLWGRMCPPDVAVNLCPGPLPKLSRAFLLSFHKGAHAGDAPKRNDEL